MTRDTFVHSAILVAIASATGAAIALIVNAGFKSTDVLAFLGALIGAGATVYGAAWLSDLRHKREVGEERKAVYRKLDELVMTLGYVRDTFGPSWEFGPETREALSALRRIAAAAKIFFAEVLATARLLTFHQRDGIRHVEADLEAVIDWYDTVFAEPGGAEFFEDRSWSSEIGALQSSAYEARNRFGRPDD